MKVNGYIKYKYDEDIRFDSINRPVKSTDLVIKSLHVGLSKGDIFLLNNAWSGTVYPTAGTGETVGVVEKVGTHTKGFKVGDHVGVGYILGSCMKCHFCQTGQYQYCEKQINTELGGFGGTMEKVIVDYRLVAKIPSGLDLANCPPWMCYGVTAYSSIKKSNLPPKSRVGVIALGGMGYMTTLLLVAMGYEVTVFSHSPEKAALAKKIGVKKFILTTKHDWSLGLNKYFDLIINTSPMDFDLNKYIVLLNAVGKFCYIGLPFNQQSFNTPKLADYGSRQIYGSYVGNTHETEELLQFVKQHHITLETINYPIDQYQKVMDEVNHGFPYKRTILSW